MLNDPNKIIKHMAIKNLNHGWIPWCMATIILCLAAFWTPFRIWLLPLINEKRKATIKIGIKVTLLIIKQKITVNTITNNTKRLAFNFNLDTGEYEEGKGSEVFAPLFDYDYDNQIVKLVYHKKDDVWEVCLEYNWK